GCFRVALDLDLRMMAVVPSDALGVERAGDHFQELLLVVELEAVAAADVASRHLGVRDALELLQIARIDAAEVRVLEALDLLDVTQRLNLPPELFDRNRHGLVPPRCGAPLTCCALAARDFHLVRLGLNPAI